MKMLVPRTWVAALLSALTPFLLPAQTTPFQDGDRVMFLGDSITHGGWYIAQLQYIWALRHPGMRVTLLNGGICGHTAKDGLARFDWDIAQQKPNRVFIMFGMNDVGHGGYWDPAKTDAKSLATRKDKVASFTANMRALIAKCRGIGASVTLMTPTPYDEYSTLVEKKALPGVNSVGLAALAEATRKLAVEEKTGLVELHAVLTPIFRDNPEVKFLSDRIHPHEDGHLLMAALVLDAMSFSPVVDEAVFDAAKGARTFAYAPKALPIPVGRNYKSDDRLYPLTAKLNQEIVHVRGLPQGSWRLKAAGKEILVCSTAELEAGVNLATLDTPSQQKSQKGVALAAKLKKLAGSLRGLPQGYIQVVRRGGDINDEKSTFEKLDQWIEELRVANLAGGHYYRYYGGEVKRFKELYPKRESELKRLETVREELFAHCRPQPYELSVEPVP